MSQIAGIDYDSEGVYIVLIDEDTGGMMSLARRRLFSANGRPETSFERARTLFRQMPARQGWGDAGVVAIGIEDPYSRFPEAIKAEARVQGAILSLLPDDLEILPLKPHTRDGWKALTVGKANASKEQVAAWARAQSAPPAVRQDFYDAFAIARATREILDQRRRRAA